MSLLTSLLRGQLLELAISPEEVERRRRHYYDRDADIGGGGSIGVQYTNNQPGVVQQQGGVSAAPTTGTAAPSAGTVTPTTGATRTPPNPQRAGNQAPARIFGPTSPMGGMTFNQKAPGIVSNLMRDFGLKDYQAAAIVGNLGHETGGFTQNQELHPRSGRGGLGWAQWTGPRRVDFENYVQQNGLDPKSDEANYGFLKQEIATKYPHAIENLKNTNDSDNAMRTWEHDYEGSGIKNYPSRTKYTNQALSSYQNGQNPPTSQQAQNTTLSAATPGKSGSYLAIGDSLAVGVGGRLGNTSYAKGGWNPQAVSGLVDQAIKNGDVQGKHIILSGGASNAGGNSQMVSDYYPKMVQALKNAGASNVTVMGVGPYANYNKYGYNDIINKTANDNGVNFTGPLANIAPFHGTDLSGGVHPNDYRPILSYVQNKFGGGNSNVAANSNNSLGSTVSNTVSSLGNMIMPSAHADTLPQSTSGAPSTATPSATPLPQSKIATGPQAPQPQPAPMPSAPPQQMAATQPQSQDPNQVPQMESYVRPAIFLIRRSKYTQVH